MSIPLTSPSDVQVWQENFAFSCFIVNLYIAVYNERRIRMAFHKALKDLNLLDRFLFAEAMEDPVIMQTILEIILGKDILLKYPPQAEKEKLIELLRYIEHTTEEVIEQRRAREEGLEEGQAIGRAEGEEHKLFVQIYKKLSKGCSLSATADSLEEEIPDIQDMYDFLKSRKTQAVEESWKDWLASGGRQSLASPGSRVTTP